MQQIPKERLPAPAIYYLNLLNQRGQTWLSSVRRVSPHKVLYKQMEKMVWGQIYGCRNPYLSALLALAN